MKRAQPLISVIVPAKNEEKLLPLCLRALTQQKTTVPFEIIVVDSNSTDRTPKIAKDNHVRYFNETQKGKVHAFRRGAEKARGDILCFTEADCIVPPHWVQTIADHFTKHPDSAAVAGLYTYTNTSLFYRLVIYPAHIIGHTAHYLWYKSHMTRGSNFAVRASVYNKIGGFTTTMSELYDTEIGHRIAKLGKIRILPSMTVQTSDRRVRGRLLAYAAEVIPAVVALIRRKPITKQTYAHIR